MHLLGVYLLCFIVHCLVVYALPQGEPSEDLSDMITPFTLKKKSTLASQETYDNIVHDKALTPPPSPSSPGVYLEDM